MTASPGGWWRWRRTSSWSACYLEDEKLVAGLPQRIRWQVVNHTGKPLEVALLASGEEGVALDYKEFLQVRHKAELGAEFTISPEIPEKEKEPRAAIVHTELLINGTPISLAAGVEVNQPVSFWLDNEGVGLRPGRKEQVSLHVCSHLEKPAEVTVRASGSAGVTLGVTEETVPLPARGTREVHLPITVAEAGAAELKVEAEVPQGTALLKPKVDPIWVHALAPGEVVGHVEKDRVVLENATLKVTVYRRSGWTEVWDKIRNRRLGQLQSPLFGPPMAWDEFFEKRCEARVERHGERVTAVLTTDSLHRPGVRLERRLTLTNLPLIEMVDTFINGGTTELKGRVQTRAEGNGNGGAYVIMTRQGLVRGAQHAAGRQFYEHNLSEEGADWPEGWMAVEDQGGAVAGLCGTRPRAYNGTASGRPSTGRCPRWPPEHRRRCPRRTSMQAKAPRSRCGGGGRCCTVRRKSASSISRPRGRRWSSACSRGRWCCRASRWRGSWWWTRWAGWSWPAG